MNADDIPLSANGAAYTNEQIRHGVPLEYIGEKLDSAIKALNQYVRHHPDQSNELVAPMYYILVAHLGLHNMLAKANDHTLAARLLAASADEIDAWLRLIAREGDVAGLADLDRR